MVESVFALPVSLEQIAALIKRMSKEDRQQLLKLVPELRSEAMQQRRTLDDSHKTVKQLQREVEQTLGGQFLSPDEPFLGNLTLQQYLNLPESERAKLWNKWAEINLEELKELEVQYANSGKRNCRKS